MSKLELGLEAMLARERAEKAEALAERRRIEREQALNVTTREGLSASEWLMRTAQAEARAEKAEADLTKLRGHESRLTDELRADLARAVEERDAMYQACADSGWHVEGGDPEGFVRRLKEERDAALVLFKLAMPQPPGMMRYPGGPGSYEAVELLKQRGLLVGERG